MRYSNWLRIGAAGILGLAGCTNNIDNRSISQPLYSLKVPQLSDIEKEVAAFSGDGIKKQRLLKQADYGERFHSSVSLFVGNYTLLVSGDFAYAFERDAVIDMSDVEKLKNNAIAIRHNGEDNSDSTLRRCAAAEELYAIMKTAESKGHLDGAAKIIGYLDRVSSRTHSVLSGFEFFFERDRGGNGPDDTWLSYKSDIAEVRDMAGRARGMFNTLPEDVRNGLTVWIGRYGHEALNGSRSETILFENNRPDGVIVEEMLPNIHDAPEGGKDLFYKSFGGDLLKGYGLLTES
ncbi:MAG: hypothetical protein HY518_00970 [Candidatus Aenigmarchaeota archaeon]|nr:hypothetical protein [Candidatus Aenigmarchaeota archaeon]